MRRITVASLILSVLLTSGAMAVARGNTQIGSLVVICHGTGYATIQIGADGTPIETAHLCPDCTLTVLPTPDLPDLTLRAVAMPGLIGLPRRDDLVPFARHDAPFARGPPALV